MHSFEGDCLLHSLSHGWCFYASRLSFFSHSFRRLDASISGPSRGAIFIKSRHLDPSRIQTDSYKWHVTPRATFITNRHTNGCCIEHMYTLTAVLLCFDWLFFWVMTSSGFYWENKPQCCIPILKGSIMGETLWKWEIVIYFFPVWVFKLWNKWGLMPSAAQQSHWKLP